MPPGDPLEPVFDDVPQLAGKVRHVEELPGGLTNENCRVDTDEGRFVVRRWSDDTGLLAIDRDHEYENSLRAAKAGIGAPVVAYLPEHNAMVFEFLDGPTMSAEDLRRGDRIALAADACRRLQAPSASSATSTCSTSSRAT
jgi:aminoglycoside phosphotransferase (APT) family kinase protein